MSTITGEQFVVHSNSRSGEEGNGRRAPKIVWDDLERAEKYLEKRLNAIRKLRQLASHLPLEEQNEIASVVLTGFLKL